MAECENGHEKIRFESPFSSMCPLCTVIHERQERAMLDKQAMQNHLDEQEGELESLQRQLDEVSQEYAEYRKRNPEK